MKRTRMKRRPPKDADAAKAFRISVLNRDLWCRACGKQPATEAHHLRNMMGKRDHSHSNGLGLCEKHHTGAEGVHVIGKETWAQRFWGCEYWEIHG